MSARHYRHNNHIRWFDPPVDPTHPGVPVAASATWARDLERNLDSVFQYAVGAAVILSVRMRTSIYPTIGDPTTGEDTVEAADPGIAYLEAAGPGIPYLYASSVGYPAMMFIDPTHRPRPSPAGLVRTLGVSLVHELAHAVNITHGNYQSHRLFTPAERARLGAVSPEEIMAWIVENMYRSERGLPLRGRYEGSPPLPLGVLPSRANTHTPLHESEYRTVERIRRRVPLLFSELARIPPGRCRYNPFRDGPTPLGPPRWARR